MKKKTLSKKKYHYFMDFKRGDYFKITRGLEDQYPNHFYGCGLGVSGIDVHWYCTSDQFKVIKAFTKRNYTKFKVTRYTEEELSAD